MERTRIVGRLVLCLTVSLVPLFFTSLTSEFFEFPKTYILYFAFLGSLTILGLKSFLGKRMEIVRTPFDLPLILLLASLSASTFFGINRILTAIDGLAPLSLGVFFYFLVVHLLHPFDPADFKAISRSFITASALVALFSLLSYFNVKIFPLPITYNRFFNPAGSESSLMILLGMSAPLALSTVLEAGSAGLLWRLVSFANISFFGLIVILHSSIFGLLVSLPSLALLFLADKEVVAKVRASFAPVITALLLVFVLFYLPLNFNQRFIDFRGSFQKGFNLDGKSSWIIAAQTVRDYPLFGTGPETFLSNYVRYRPISLNLTPHWNQRFTQPGAEPYQILSTLGLIGFAVSLLLYWKIGAFCLRLLSLKNGNDGLALSILSFLIALLFGSPTPVVKAVFFLLLGVYVLKSTEAKSRSFSVIPVVPLVLAGVVGLLLGYFFYTTLLAEVNFKKALDSSAVNTQQTINYLNSAIRMNPNRDNYHLSAATLAYTLASNLVATKGNNLDNLSGPEKQLLSDLLNSAINEGKTAVTINPFNGTNLETLASFYASIAGAVQNSGAYAIAAYQQAIRIEPTNPNLRFQLGSLFFAANDFENSAILFSQAVQLKGDLPNYRYNLAWALKNRGLITEAVDEMTFVTRLVDPTSPDGAKAQLELTEFIKLSQEAREELSKRAAAASPEGGLELNKPEGSLANPSGKKVELSGQASPPEVKRK